MRVSGKYSEREKALALQDSKLTEIEREIIQHVLKTGSRESAKIFVGIECKT